MELSSPVFGTPKINLRQISTIHLWHLGRLLLVYSLKYLFFNSSTEATIGCNSGVCNFLSKDMELQTPMRKIDTLLAHHVLASILRNGMRDDKGRPLSVEMFAIGDEPTWMSEIYGTLLVSTVGCFGALVGYVTILSLVAELMGHP